jgi:hypothetical protein
MSKILDVFFDNSFNAAVSMQMLLPMLQNMTNKILVVIDTNEVLSYDTFEDLAESMSISGNMPSFTFTKERPDFPARFENSGDVFWISHKETIDKLINLITK